jgi:hypothetical protein
MGRNGSANRRYYQPSVWQVEGGRTPGFLWFSSSAWEPLPSKLRFAA